MGLSCEELWQNGAVVETPFDRSMALSDAALLWGPMSVHCAKPLPAVNR